MASLVYVPFDVNVVTVGAIGRLPLTLGSVSVVLPATAGAITVTVPDVLPLSTTDPVPGRVTPAVPSTITAMLPLHHYNAACGTSAACAAASRAAPATTTATCREPTGTASTADASGIAAATTAASGLVEKCRPRRGRQSGASCPTTSQSAGHLKWSGAVNYPRSATSSRRACIQPTARSAAHQAS